MRSHMPRNMSYHRRPNKSQNLFVTDGRLPSDKKPIKGVDNSAPFESAKAVGMKLSIWKELVWGKLVVVPRENLTLYRHALMLVRHNVCIQKELTAKTLYITIHPDLLEPRRADRIKEKNSESKPPINYLRIGKISRNKCI